MRELIVYATPTGPLAQACADYFEAANQLGGTAAQTYPPHCTLTGFFRRTDARVDQIAATVQEHVDRIGEVPTDAVRVTRLGFHDAWVGLELEAPRLLTWTEALAAALPPGPGEDALRCKTWLHLSLAYGVDDLDPWRTLVADHLDHAQLPVADSWELALWERCGMDWHRLTR